MAAGNTYEAIATISPTTTPTEITFSSIPSTYTDLILILSGSSSGSSNVYIRVNGDTASNYSYTTFTADGSTVASYRNSNLSVGLLMDYNSYPNSTTNSDIIIAQFNNYKNTTTYKTCIARGSNAISGVDANVSLWRSTSAITSLTLRLGNGAGTWATGTIASLYGIAAA
jgi:hypothetical protein